MCRPYSSNYLAIPSPYSVKFILLKSVCVFKKEILKYIDGQIYVNKPFCMDLHGKQFFIIGDLYIIGNSMNIVLLDNDQTLRVARAF